MDDLESNGRRLDVCEGCFVPVPPDDLVEMDEQLTELNPYPETVRLCPKCAEVHAEDLEEQLEEYRLSRED